MQLNKYIAHAGFCSRRKAVEIIQAGHVTVNNKVVNEPGYVVQEGDEVKVGNKRVVLQQKVYILLNKPKGYITTKSDDQNRPTVMNLLDKKHYSLYPVGRLDKDTSGILIMTNDGELAQRLAHPKYEIKKTYIVTLDKPFEGKDLDVLRRGIKLFDGPVEINSIMCLNKARTRVKVTLHSGKNRIIRRMFYHLGYEIKELDRIAFAHITKKNLPVGSWRLLTENEMNKFYTHSKIAIKK